MKLDVDDDTCIAVVNEKWSIREVEYKSWMVNVYKGKVLHRLVAHTGA